MRRPKRLFGSFPSGISAKRVTGAGENPPLLRSPGIGLSPDCHSTCVALRHNRLSRAGDRLYLDLHFHALIKAFRNRHEPIEKKSKRGIATPKKDMDIIRARLNVAEALAKEL